MTQDKILGKLCFQCDENLRPEDFELLKLLSEVIVGLFDAFLLRASLLSDREEMIRMSVAEKMLATMAHNIGSRLAPLPLLLFRYRNLEKKYSELSAVNDSLDYFASTTLDTVKRAKEFFALPTPRKASIDLPARIERTLHQALPDETWVLECQDRQLELAVDYHLLETALLELIQNSRSSARDPNQLRISITIKIESRQSDFVTIVYKDNGPGIHDDLKERIFEDFFSLRPGHDTGTGLGMGMVRRVIEAHGGVVFARPSAEGAEFVITLPRQ
ncbi:MAG TPA: sensor histidine kinase [Pyrinomonadaceae bacterium]|nr:sensor histidine kinase [Pyrinomonadaceae bacterium]